MRYSSRLWNQLSVLHVVVNLGIHCLRFNSSMMRCTALEYLINTIHIYVTARITDDTNANSPNLISIESLYQCTVLNTGWNFILIPFVAWIKCNEFSVHLRELRGKFIIRFGYVNDSTEMDLVRRKMPPKFMTQLLSHANTKILPCWLNMCSQSRKWADALNFQ